MRKWVEYAVENYRGKNSFGFQLAKDLKERQVAYAIERYARGVKPEEVVALMDTSVCKSGKKGFLFTDRYLYSDRYKEEGPVDLLLLESVSVKPENNSCCVLTYEEGRTREVDISVFLDVVEVLALIMRRREEAVNGAEEAAEAEGVSEAENAAEEESVSEAERMLEAENAAEAMGRIEEKNRLEADSAAEEKDGPEAAMLGLGEIWLADGKPAQEEDRWDGEELPEENSEVSIEILQLDDLDDPEETAVYSVEIPAESQGDEERRLPAKELEAESYEELLERAEAGDRAAMFRVAELYYTGQQIAEDKKEALRWFRESARLEYVPAMLRMMRFYCEGELVKQNLTLGMSWAKKAAATGEPEGQYALARAYIYGTAGKQDVEAGLAILNERADAGDETALQMAAEVCRKIREAKEQFEAGSKNPSTASGYYEMGMYCRKGDGFYTYPKEAAQYFQKAAEKGHVQAQYQLGCACLYGEGVKKNEDECVRWLNKAAAKSHKEAEELLGEILKKQRARWEKDEFKGHLKQAEKGDCYAQSKVAECYLEGTGVKQDAKKAIEWYEKASETDDGYAARQLAKLYSEGGIIPKDKERAAYWRMVGGILDEL